MPGVIDIVHILTNDIAGSKQAIIHDAAHMVNMEKPEEFNRIVLDFLTQL